MENLTQGQNFSIENQSIQKPQEQAIKQMLIESSHQFDAILNQILSFPHTRCQSSDLCLPQLERISLGSKFKAKTVIILVTFYVRQKYFPLLSWVALYYSYKIRAIKKGEISPRDIACRCWNIRAVAFSSGHLIVMLMASYRQNKGSEWPLPVGTRGRSNGFKLQFPFPCFERQQHSE